ncbi:hypothetical protein [Pseudoxanthomonas putridarboris]|uniref:Uncharacterized protein n=1 Tax=Pseudoxanthomonas putridarboris TaxID=752605 RepID=A0ABU9J5Q9_9GAMM
MSTAFENSILSDGSRAQSATTGYLIGPVWDFLVLGGGSILPLLLVMYWWPQGADTTPLLASTLLVANLINHPHFAHSYQLFYRDFRARGFGDRFPASLRWRYLFAGILVPLLLAAFFAYCIATRDTLLLGRAVNLMLFLVGWHYVKQGYGMLMVDAVLKRNFFDPADKRWLLVNAYAVWITSWLLVNRTLAVHNYWDLKYYTFGIPDSMMWLAWLIVSATTALMLRVMWKKLSAWRHKTVPLNGAIAYLVSLYLWLLVRHPAMLLVIPAFHSLQYLAVVWRYRLNIERQTDADQRRLFRGRGPWPGFALFLFLGTVLGYLGFWMAPMYLDSWVDYDKALFGGALFMFIFWIFINIHHYFLDNVMWRKNNPDTRRYLFGG